MGHKGKYGDAAGVSAAPTLSLLLLLPLPRFPYALRKRVCCPCCKQADLVKGPGYGRAITRAKMAAEHICVSIHLHSPSHMCGALPAFRMYSPTNVQGLYINIAHV